jgi:aspartate/methionine/tyrosine aminotransferase
MSGTERPDRAVLSKRAQQLLASPPNAEYLREHFVRSVAPYDPVSNPDGYIPMCIAENLLVWDLLRSKVQTFRDVPHRALCYDSMIGSMEFRRRLARFAGRTFLGREIHPEHVAVLAGAGTVLEIVFHALADRGEGVLVPTPSYAGFWPDLQTRDELAIVPVHCSSEDGFALTTRHLDRALASAGRPVRALLFTTPNNPLGRVYTAREIEDVLRWAEAAKVHVVFDEIYALSVFGERPFVSCASLRGALGDRVHIVWAFSKDFGASGLRCGVLVTENEALIAAVDSLAYWACCSGDTQVLLGQMISDDAWVDAYVAGMRGRLRDAYRSITGALDEKGIPYLAAEAGFFFLCDLRRFMAEPTWEGEHALWRRMLEEANVNLTPGSACRVAEPGFMRLCFASVPIKTALAGVRRLGRVLRPDAHRGALGGPAARR